MSLKISRKVFNPLLVLMHSAPRQIESIFSPLTQTNQKYKNIYIVKQQTKISKNSAMNNVDMFEKLNDYLKGD